MAYAITSASGECSAQWFADVDRVVLGVGYPALSVQLTLGEARALIVDLTAAVTEATATQGESVPASVA